MKTVISYEPAHTVVGVIALRCLEAGVELAQMRKKELNQRQILLDYA